MASSPSAARRAFIPRPFVDTPGLGVAAAVAVAVIHLAIAPEHFAERTYIGTLFVVGSVLLLYAVAGLSRRGAEPFAWLLAALICAGMFVGLLAAGTVGLPSYHEELDEPIALVSLTLEAVVITVAVTELHRALGAVRPREPAPRQPPAALQPSLKGRTPPP